MTKLVVIIRTFKEAQRTRKTTYSTTEAKVFNDFEKNINEKPLEYLK